MVVDHLVHRKELDGTDTERLEVAKHRARGERRVGAAPLARDPGKAHRQVAHVRLVDHVPAGAPTRLARQIGACRTLAARVPAAHRQTRSRTTHLGTKGALSRVS